MLSVLVVCSVDLWGAEYTSRGSMLRQHDSAVKPCNGKHLQAQCAQSEPVCALYFRCTDVLCLFVNLVCLKQVWAEKRMPGAMQPETLQGALDWVQTHPLTAAQNG